MRTLKAIWKQKLIWSFCAALTAAELSGGLTGFSAAAAELETGVTQPPASLEAGASGLPGEPDAGFDLSGEPEEDFLFPDQEPEDPGTGEGGTEVLPSDYDFSLLSDAEKEAVRRAERLKEDRMEKLFGDQVPSVDLSSLPEVSVQSVDSGYGWELRDGVLTITRGDEDQGYGKADTIGYIEGEPYDYNTRNSGYLNEITKIVIKSGIRNYHHRFRHLPRLEEVVIEDPCYLGELVYGQFRYNPNLRKVTFGDMRLNSKGEDELTEFWGRTFADNPLLSEVKLGRGIAHFGDHSFRNCVSLKEITLSYDMHDLKGNTFAGCDSLERISLFPKNPFMSSVDGVIYGKKDPYSDFRKEYVITPSLIAVPNGKPKANGGHYTVAKGVKSILYGAMEERRDLKDVVVASTVEVIGPQVFQNCTNLRSVTLPKTLRHIGLDSFRGCTSLKDIYYEGSEAEWKQVQYADYKIDEKVNLTRIRSTGLLWNNLKMAGLSENRITIHCNSPLKDTEELPDLDGDIPDYSDIRTEKFTLPVTDETGTPVSVSVTYSGMVSYNGKGHVTALTKKSGKVTRDVALSVNVISSLGDRLELKKAVFRYNKAAASRSDPRAPRFTLSFRAADGASREQKKLVKRINRALKKYPIKFTIAGADLSLGQYQTGAVLNSGKTKVKSVWVAWNGNRKYTKVPKKDYTASVEDGTVTVKGRRNFSGTKTMTVFIGNKAF